MIADREFLKKLKPNQILSQSYERLMYSYDASNWRGTPSLVLLPSTPEETIACVKLCVEKAVKFVARGAGTNLAGASIAPKDEVVLGLTQLNKIVRLDADNQVALVEAGVVNLELQKRAGKQGLFFAPDPASQKVSTIGGNIAQNSGGPHCLKYGITTHHVMAVEVIHPDGSLAWIGNPYGEQAGPDLRGLYLGAEGSLGIVTRAWVRLLPLPKATRTAIFSFANIQSAVQAVSGIIAKGIIPSTLELMDQFILRAVEENSKAGYPKDAATVLLVEVDGEPEELEEMLEDIAHIVLQHDCRNIQIAGNEDDRAKLWEGRKGAHAAVARLRPSVWVEDGTVPRNRLAEALQKLQAIAQEQNLQVGYLFHAGDGNFHPLILFDDRNHEEWEKVRRAGGEMLKMCVDLGGSITGEHGVGIDKLPYMSYQFDENTLQIMAEVKRVIDPGNLCNPGKLLPPEYVQNAVVRQGSSIKAPREKTSLFEPQTQEEAEDLIFKIKREGGAVSPCGAKTKWPASLHGTQISTRFLNKIIDYDPSNLTLHAESGAVIKDLEELVESDGLKLGIAPSFPARATLGGVLSTHDGGPWRFFVRDQVLGLKAILPDGRWLKVGRKVVKNVAGLDVAKLFLGARGSFGLITECILKLHPVDQQSSLLIYQAPSEASCREAFLEAKRKKFDIAAFSYLSHAVSKRLSQDLALPLKGEHGAFLLVDAGGRRATEHIRRERLQDHLRLFGLQQQFVFEGENRKAVWNWVRNWGAEEGISLWQVWAGLEQMTAMGQDQTLSQPNGEWLLHFSSGERRFKVSANEMKAVQNALRSLKLFPSLLKGGFSFPSLCEEANVPLLQKLKGHFDPHGLFPAL